MGSDALYHNFVGFTRVQPPRGYLPHLLVCSRLVFMSSQCFIIGIPCSQVKVNVYWLWITSEHINLCDQVLESAGDELPRPPWSHNNPRYQEHQAMSSGGMDQAGLLYLNIFLLRVWICDNIQLIIPILYKSIFLMQFAVFWYSATFEININMCHV